MTKQVDHEKRRRERSMCAVGGCLIETGDEYRCDEHRRAHAAAEKARYWRRREERARAVAA